MPGAGAAAAAFGSAGAYDAPTAGDAEDAGAVAAAADCAAAADPTVAPTAIVLTTPPGTAATNAGTTKRASTSTTAPMTANSRKVHTAGPKATRAVPPSPPSSSALRSPDVDTDADTDTRPASVTSTPTTAYATGSSAQDAPSRATPVRSRHRTLTIASASTATRGSTMRIHTGKTSENIQTLGRSSARSPRPLKSPISSFVAPPVTDAPTVASDAIAPPSAARNGSSTGASSTSPMISPAPFASNATTAMSARAMSAPSPPMCSRACTSAVRARLRAVRTGESTKKAAAPTSAIPAMMLQKEIARVVKLPDAPGSAIERGATSCRITATSAKAAPAAAATTRRRPAVRSVRGTARRANRRTDTRAAIGTSTGMNSAETLNDAAPATDVDAPSDPPNPAPSSCAMTANQCGARSSKNSDPPRSPRNNRPPNNPSSVIRMLAASAPASAKPEVMSAAIHGSFAANGAGTFSRAVATAPANACCAFCPCPGTGAPCGAYGCCGAAAGACGGTGAPGYCGGIGGVAAASSPGFGPGPPSFGRD